MHADELEMTSRLKAISLNSPTQTGWPIERLTKKHAGKQVVSTGETSLKQVTPQRMSLR